MKRQNYQIKIVLAFLCFVIVFAGIFFVTKRADIYANLGRHYSKKNNYSKAQSYYEKSYQLGNKETKFRENYVNYLVNSPLTIEAQERLVQIAEDNIKDSASESAKYFLYNLKREIHNKYPENYIQQAPYNQKIMHWGKLPITYTFRQTKDIPKELISAVDQAFDAWERASSVRIRFERVSGNADIVVNFTDKQIKNPETGQKYVIAYTVPRVSQNRLERMDIIFSVTNLDGSLYSSNQIYNTALHELFHALGFMGHSIENNNIMRMSHNTEDMDPKSRFVLTKADKNTLELLYKIKPDITNANELKYEYIPYLIIGNNAEINYAKEDEALNYIRKAPSIPAGYIDLAQTLLNQEKYMEAINYLERAFRLAHDDETKYMVFYNLAVANYYDGSWELAHIYVKKAQEIKDEDELHVLNAEIYQKEDKLKECIDEYNYLNQKSPDNIDYVISLANIYLKKKDYMKVRKIIKQYQKKYPQEKKNPRFAPYKSLLIF